LRTTAEAARGVNANARMNMTGSADQRCRNATSDTVLDPRVPIAGAWKFYRALKALGKTVELDIYPRGGHVLYEPALQREAMRRNLDWFTRWIPPDRRP